MPVWFIQCRWDEHGQQFAEAGRYWYYRDCSAQPSKAGDSGPYIELHSGLPAACLVAMVVTRYNGSSTKAQ